MSETAVPSPFRSAADARAATTLGMWIFLGAEGMLFGAVMLAYLIARLRHPGGFAAGSAELDFALGTANTAILLTSSLAMALAEGLAGARRNGHGRTLLLAAMALGAAFLAVKGVEYASEASRGLLPLPGLDFRYDGPDPAGARLFLDFYFATTGLHGVHLLGGIAAAGWLAAGWRRLPPATRMRRAGAVALYWHFVDVVWVFLYPLLYLIDR